MKVYWTLNAIKHLTNTLVEFEPGSYLTIWTDGSVRKLLEAGPRIKDVFRCHLFSSHLS